MSELSETLRFEAETAYDDDLSYAERLLLGDIVPLSLWKRFMKLFKFSFRFISGAIAWISWHLYGRTQYNLAVKKSLERWKQLAGVGKKSDEWQAWNAQWHEHERLQAQKIMLEKPATEAEAMALHAEIIRSTVRKLPLPPPDVDDFAPHTNDALWEAKRRADAELKGLRSSNGPGFLERHGVQPSSNVGSLPITTSTAPPKE